MHQVIKNRRFGDKELYFLNFMLLMGGSADSRDEQGRTPLDMCDDMAARAIIKQAYRCSSLPYLDLNPKLGIKQANRC